MPDAIRLICPNLKCRAILSVPPSARGKAVRCRACSMRVQVPAGGKPKPAPTPEAEAVGQSEATVD
jgi:hypothetical protein